MLTLLSDAMKDLRFGVRVLRRSPVFTVVAVSSLALGIGGSAAVFSLINAIALRALPVEDPHRLFIVERRRADETIARFSWPGAQSLRDELAGKADAGRAELAAAAPVTTLQFRLEGTGSSRAAERATVQLVSGEYFDVLRQRPELGRLLTPADNRQLDGHPVAVISHGFWQRQFGGAAAVIGRTIVLNGTTFTVVGVADPRFFGNFVSVRGVDAWVPLVMQSAVRYAGNASSHDSGDTRKPWPPQENIEWLNLLVRVPAGTAPETVAAALTVRFQADASLRGDDSAYIARLRADRLSLAPAGRGQSSLRTSTSATLYVLLAMMGALLLIACGNVGGLLTARAMARQREMAVRLSLGAGRWRLVRQLMAETLLLGLAGGWLGLGLAVWGRELLLALLVGGQPAIMSLDIGLDWNVLAFAAAATLLTAIVCGTVPALRGTRVPIADSLKIQARAVGLDSGRTQRLGRVLVVAQIAFCLVLLVVAGLFVRSFRTLAASEIGFDRHNVLGARLDIRSMGLDAPARAVLYERLLERVQAVPGVVSASLSQNGPVVTSSQISGISVAGYTPREGERMSSNEEIVTERYFSTVGLRLLKGRAFGPEDRVANAKATIVNEAMVRRFFPNTDPLGKRWSYDSDTAATADAFVVVGVVEDAKYRDLRSQVPTMIYHLSGPSEDAVLSDLEVRTSGAPETMIGTIRQVLAEAEPRLPAYDILPIGARVSRLLAQDSMIAQLTSIFGGMALLLACLGLYGTIAYGVNRRVGELGLRLALGAERRQVLWLVMREALALVILGAVVGLPLTYAASRSVGTMLYGIGPVDPTAYAAGAALLVAVGLTAAFFPALRAARIDPLMAISRV